MSQSRGGGALPQLVEGLRPLRRAFYELVKNLHNFRMVIVGRRLRSRACASVDISGGVSVEIETIIAIYYYFFCLRVTSTARNGVFFFFVSAVRTLRLRGSAPGWTCN